MAPVLDQAFYLDRLYKATPEVVPLDPLNQDDYRTQFWVRARWQEDRDKGIERGAFNSGKQGQGVNSSFLEDENGERVSLTRQNEIHEEVHTTWRTMHQFKIELKPLGSMGAPAREYFRKRMEVVCPELQLCANHWKSDKLWSENFSSWTKPARRGPAGRQPQDIDDEPPQRQRRQRKLYEFLCTFKPILKYPRIATAPPLKLTCLPPFHTLVPQQLPFRLQKPKPPRPQTTPPPTITMNQGQPTSPPSRQTTIPPQPPQPHLPTD